MRLRTALALAAVALLAVAAGAYFALSGGGSLRGLPFARVAPKPVPELTILDAAGKARSLAEFRGRLVLLNVWATWCAPCREEMPALDRLQAALGSPRFEVVALSVDQQGAAIAARFFAEVGVKSLALYVDPSAQAAFKLDAPGLPVTLLVDCEGREIGRHLGAVKWDSPEIVEALRRRIEKETGERSAPGEDARAAPRDAAEVALGAKVYAQNCAACHGASLQGQPEWRRRLPSGRMPAPPHDESGHTWHHPDDVLFGMTKRGVAPYAPAGYQSDMPAFGGTLSDEEIWAVLAFIKSHWRSREVLDTRAEMLRNLRDR
jgi:mono/diheme cytochrome c family protein